MSDLIVSILLGAVEGITEFLPISSTGHLLLCERLLGLNLDEDFWKTFAVFIQIGAILAVVVYFRRRIMDLLLGRSRAAAHTPLEISARSPVPAVVPSSQHDYASAGEPTVEPALRRAMLWNIVLGTIPVLIIGFLTHKKVEQYLETPKVIAGALAIGGVIILLIEWLPTNVTTRRMEDITWPQALGIGFAQVLSAVFPGTSRSAATIMGGMLGGLSRPAATEFSFFLAIPAMFAACGYSLLKYARHAHPGAEQLLLMLIGTIVSFVVAWAVIAVFMDYIRRHNFIPFALYRIALGVVVILLMAGGNSHVPASTASGSGPATLPMSK